MSKRNCIILISFFVLFLNTALFSNSDMSLNEHDSHNPPPPPINDVCTGATNLGILECGYINQQFLEDPEATPDPEATGNCIGSLDLGQWYTFATPNPLPYSSIFWNGSWTNVEIFTSSSGCSDLVYVDCFMGISFFLPEPGTTYYILSTGGFVISTAGDWESECDDPANGNAHDGMWASSTDCNTPSAVVPCENEHVVWYEYTTGCGISDLSIVVTENNLFIGATADEISISVFHDDCISLLTDYDPAGLGYVCSAMINSESLELIDIPPLTHLIIAFGSGVENMGDFDYFFNETSDTDDVSNDICNDFEVVITGINAGLTNECSTNSGQPTDAYIPGCNNEATVWYEYDPGGVPMDIDINILSTGIANPAIAAFEGCIGTLLDSECGTSIKLLCIDYPISIEIASNFADMGTFDLEIISTPSSPGVAAVVTSTDICSGSEANIDITIPNGDLVNITIEIAPGSSPLINGMTNQTVNGTSNAKIDDVLVNNSTTPQEAIYLITISNTGLGCPPEPIEHSIFVFPPFNTTTITIEACLPHLVEINIEDIITGGSPPYNSISWFWNGIDPIGTGNPLSYDLTESGTITVEVVDNEGCTALTSIGVTTLIPILPTFDIPDEYCQSDQDYIAFPNISLEGIEGTWNPSLIDVSEITMPEYISAVFTPNADYCGLPITETIFVFAGLDVAFDLPDVLCSQEDMYVFPDTDLNGLMGYWQTPSIDLSTISGTQYNTFVVSTPGCFLDFEYEYDVLSSISLEFDVPESICKNAPSITLNNISEQGYEGTWDVSVIDPSSITDDFITATWSPQAGQSPCLSDTTITIAITTPFVPSFDLPDELCATDTIFTFPTEDLQSVTGNWSVTIIDPSNDTGTIVSEFTPDDDCASVFTWEIEIAEPVVPFFDFDTLYCSLDSGFVLPTESENGILGIWSMPAINPFDLAGQELTLQFTGSMLGECVEAIETVINIEEAQDLEFDIVDEYCWNDNNILLPDSSLNGVLGSWEPSVIDVQANIGQAISIQFTPELGACFRTYTQEIEVLAPYIVVANAVDPTSCNVEDGTITLDVQQGQNLEFSIDFGVNWQSTNMFEALSSGSYSILVRSTDNVLCELTIDAYLNATDGPIINEVVSTNVNDCSSPNGIITIDAEGTNLEYSIDGINWQSTNVFEGLPPGNYEIEIREALSDCIVTANAAIIDFPDTEITMISTNDVSDCNAADGTIEIIAVGLALEYSIDNGITWSPSNIFAGLEAGTYEIIIQSTEGINCSSSSEAVLIEPSLPILLDVVVESPSICNPINGSLLVNADGSNLEYSIDGGATWQDEVLFSDLPSDEYQVIIRDKEFINCYTETLVPIDIEFDQLDESILQATPTSDCDLEDGSIEIINNFSDVEYSIDNGITWQQTALFDNLPAGVYIVISRKIALPDCRVEQSIEIPNPDCPCNDLMLAFSVSNTSCEDEVSGMINLISVEGMTNNDINILWQNGTTGELVEGVEQGWQTVTIEYDELCIWTDSVYVDKLSPIQFDLLISEISCQNSSDGTIEVVNVDGGSNNYMFSIDGENYQSENQFSDLEAGNYEVYVIDETDCLTIKNAQIESSDEVQISLNEIEIIIEGESIVLNPGIEASQVDSFSWSTINGSLNSTNLIIEVSPKSTTTYVLEIFYGGCYDRREVTIEVTTEDNDIVVGNIFSPNGDNINDLLYIQGKLNSSISLNQFRIYDRWGNVLFEVSLPEMNNAGDGWNGYSQGKLVISGVYVYQVNYTEDGQSFTKYGTVTVVY